MSFLSLLLGQLDYSVSVVREYRLVDNRSTASPLLVTKLGGNTTVWSLVEAQTPRFGGGIEGRRILERAGSAILSLLVPALGWRFSN